MRETQLQMQGVQSVLDTVTALAGGGKAGATPLTAAINRVSVCATNADSVLAPPAKKGIDVFIINDGAASLAIFGQGTDTIDGTVTTTAKSLAAAGRTWLVCYADGAWVSK